MAYKSPLSQSVSNQKENGLVKFSGDYGKREFGAPVVAPQTDLGRSMQDFTSLSSVSSSDSSDTPVNPAKAARQRGRQERRSARQSARAERIEKRNAEKIQKTKQRQQIKNIKQGLDANAGMKDYKSEFKKMGENFNNQDFSIKSSSLSDVLRKIEFVPSSGGDYSMTKKQTNKPKIATKPKDTFNYTMPDKPLMGNTAMDRVQGSIADERYFYSPEETSSDSPNTFVDPTMASVGIEPQMTFQPPMPANEMGIAKPVFNPQVQASAEAIYGTPLQRQMSVNSGFMMQSPLEGNAFTKAMADTGGDYEAAQEILKNK